MQSSHTFTVDSAVFDERNLVSAAGLVPVLELAEQTGLSELIAEHVQLPSTRVRSGAVNPAGKPWSMPDLSRAIGVSARTLQDGFQRYVGVSPTCYLREVRLQRARADLSNPALCTTVSDTAYRWGFAHLGRLLWPIATSSASRPRRHCQVGIERTSITDAVTLAVPGGRCVTVTFWACRVDRMAQRLRCGVVVGPILAAGKVFGHLADLAVAESDAKCCLDSWHHSDSPMCWSRAASSAR